MGRAQGPADGDLHRQPYTSVHTRVGRPSGLRRGPETQGIESASCGPHAAAPAGPDRHSGRPGRPRSGRTACRTGAAGYRSTVELAHVDQGYTGSNAAEPHNSMASGWKSSSNPWQNEASSCCRADGSWNTLSPGPLASDRLARDYERLPRTLAAIHFIASANLMTARLIKLALTST